MPTRQIDRLVTRVENLNPIRRLAVLVFKISIHSEELIDDRLRSEYAARLKPLRVQANFSKTNVESGRVISWHKSVCGVPDCSE